LGGVEPAEDGNQKLVVLLQALESERKLFLGFLIDLEVQLARTSL